MDTFAKPLAALLAFFYDLIPNYAAAIALLTLVVMLVLLPLTLKGTRSMLAMQKIAPEVKKLQDKHKNDRQRLNEEVMALYRDNKISPLGGCFPLLLQLPVFWVLYATIHGLTNHAPNGAYAPKYLDSSSLLYEHLVAAQGKMVSFGMDLSKAATGTHSSWYAAIPFFALVIIMVAAQYWQQRQISSRTPAGSDSPQAAQMRTIQKFFPPVFGVVSLGFPAALVLYWAFSSVLRVVQQWGIYRFDPLLKTQVDGAKKEAEGFLKAPDRTSKSKAKADASKATNASSSDNPAKAISASTSAKVNKKKRKGR